VLEIGAGTGGTTTYVLPLLPAGRTSYTFTDLSPLFLERAAEQFGEHAFVERALLDIERDPSAQGFAPGGYDIVIAANVLHATADLRQALRHVQGLMAPGGVLLLLEGMAPERWVDLTFGLTDGWWRFVDEDLRPDYPLIGRDAWQAVLPSLGFSEVLTVPAHAGGSRARRQQALIVARTPVLARRWNLVGGPPALAQALSRRLQARGDTVGVCAPDAFDAQLPAAGDWVYLGALELAGAARDDAATPRRCQALACEGPLRWLARLAKEGAAARGWLVTSGAHAAGGAAAEDGRWQAPLWGVGRVFALEQPQRWGGLVDLAPGSSADAMAATLLAAFDADDDEDQTAWRDGARLACRLLEAPTPAPAALHLRADGTYLISGGFGGLGLLVARWMVERGARHLALLGRHPDAALPELRALEALGATLHCLQGDVADATAMDGLLRALAAKAPPLRGIVHAAAELSAAPITELSAAQVAGMLRPKLDGTLVLERLAEREGMDFLVLFSSTTALLGAAGLAHYAAANLFLDASAEQARRAGRPVLSVNWGTWEAMRLASVQSRQGFRQAGLEPMPAADALDALARLLGSEAAQGVVARIDWQALKPVHEARRSRPFLRHLGRPASTVAPAALPQPPPDGGAIALAQRLACAPAGARRDVLIDFVQQEAAAVLGWQDRGPLPLGTGLFDLGMDSLMAVELKRRLERGIGHPLPATLTFNYPNIGALARFFEAELSQREASPPAAPGPAAVADASVALPDAPLDALSEDQLEARLLACLERMQ
jgi:SAM-dependent methyltransferase/NADP-dependent 3-hydroxy acid dehydrogenase YdfG/acyl carrier protein